MGDTEMTGPDTRERLAYGAIVIFGLLVAFMHDQPALIKDPAFMGFVGVIAGGTLNAAFGYYFGASKGGAETATKMTDAMVANSTPNSTSNSSSSSATGA